MVVERVADLKEAMVSKNREAVIKVVHGMKPQVLFFEVSEAALPMQAIEMQGVEMLWIEMEERCSFLVGQLELAVTEVKTVISEQP